MRDAPSLDIVAALQRAGASIVAYDPEGMEMARPLLPDVAFGPGPYEVAAGQTRSSSSPNGAPSARSISPRLKGLMRTPVLVDLATSTAAARWEAAGFVYDRIGESAAGTAR